MARPPRRSALSSRRGWAPTPSAAPRSRRCRRCGRPTSDTTRHPTTPTLPGAACGAAWPGRRGLRGRWRRGGGLPRSRPGSSSCSASEVCGGLARTRSRGRPRSGSTPPPRGGGRSSGCSTGRRSLSTPTAGWASRSGSHRAGATSTSRARRTSVSCTTRPAHSSCTPRTARFAPSGPGSASTRTVTRRPSGSRWRRVPWRSPSRPTPQRRPRCAPDRWRRCRARARCACCTAPRS